jgi:hypothetical protein
MRESLKELAGYLGLPPPDDEIVRRVLDCGRGASAEQIHASIVAMYKREKFREMRSWGLLPMVVEQCFHAA